MPQRSGSVRLGIDIGGTFTDIVCLNPDGSVHTKKVPSTVDNYARAIMHGLRDLFEETGLGGDEIGEICHGTTVASNAVLEMTGARVGLITTKGFRDTLEIRRLRMPRLYDLSWQKPPPLIERSLRVEIDERINAKGTILTAVDSEEIGRALHRLLREGIDALAVCLINSYANPIHEQRVHAMAKRIAPELPVCMSSEILPEIKEYERTSTTVINAYVMPVVQTYLATLRMSLDEMGIRSRLLIMQSNGGTMSAERAAKMPMHIIESGPAAGVVGSRALARRMQLPDVLTLDMGGTTAKASIIEGGQLSHASEYEVGAGIMQGSRLLRGAGYLLRVPAIDLAEVGAGGGSIVWIDAGGSLQVGPRSAGAAPGPVCYDRGGTEPTITDANVILGYLNPDYLLDGAVTVNAAKAHEAFGKRIAQPLGFDLADAALGAHMVAASNMTRAIKAVSSARGRDPRRYVLMAFGGNGPLFASTLAQALGVKRIVIPPAPGLFSSFGLLYSDVEHHHSRTYLRSTSGIDVAELNHVVRQLEEDALGQLAADGFARTACTVRRYADLRYRGQSFELTIPIGEGVLDTTSIAELAHAFGREHETTYGHRAGDDAPMDIVTVRVIGRGIPDRPRIPERIQMDRRKTVTPTPQRQMYFGRRIGWRAAAVIRRHDLTGARPGPCVVEEYDATCVIPPGATAALDEFGNIVMDML